MATQAPSSAVDNFRAAVAAAPLLRRDLDLARDRGPFVVIGHPRDWRNTADALARAGVGIVAFHDLCFDSRRLFFARRPVWRGRWSGPLSGHQVVLAGPVKKRYFDGPPDEVVRCLYAEPLTGWRQFAHHTPKLGDKTEELARIWADLADEDSRAVFASAVRARSDGDAGFFRVSPYREYDHPVVRARPGDTVIDAGAYWGDSARRFAWQLRGRGSIVALEPSPKNYRRLVRQRLPGLIPLCLGAWNANEVLRFSEKGGSSQITDQGDSTIHVAPIDWIVRELDLQRVDLLKLDVEGAEREALAGASETLQRFRPKVQLSIYHRRQDIYELPQLLSSTLDDYRYYVGHHGPYHTETDLYAIPAERV
jgi:FkbM family methyltransferase